MSSKKSSTVLGMGVEPLFSERNTTLDPCRAAHTSAAQFSRDLVLPELGNATYYELIYGRHRQERLAVLGNPDANYLKSSEGKPFCATNAFYSLLCWEQSVVAGNAMQGLDYPDSRLNRLGLSMSLDDL